MFGLTVMMLFLALNNQANHSRKYSTAREVCRRALSVQSIMPVYAPVSIRL